MAKLEVCRTKVTAQMPAVAGQVTGMSEGADVRCDRAAGGVCEDDFHSSQKLFAILDRNNIVI